VFKNSLKSVLGTLYVSNPCKHSLSLGLTVTLGWDCDPDPKTFLLKITINLQYQESKNTFFFTILTMSCKISRSMICWNTLSPQFLLRVSSAYIKYLNTKYPRQVIIVFNVITIWKQFNYNIFHADRMTRLRTFT